MLTFSVTTRSSFDSVWAFMRDLRNLPRWDAGTAYARKLAGAEWEVGMRPLSGRGGDPIVLRGCPKEWVRPKRAGVETWWTYEGGGFAAADGWRVEDEGDVRRVTYELRTYALRGWRAWVCCFASICAVEPALRAYAREDRVLLKGALDGITL